MLADDELRTIWRHHAQGRLSDSDAQAAAEAAHARRASRDRAAPPTRSRAATGRRRAGKGRRREKLFGPGRPRPLDRNVKVRIMHLATALTRRTEPGKHYGVITAKALSVLKALLWGFHNAKSGLCFPSYEKIAEAAGCARSTVYEAISAIEAAGLMTWCNRLIRRREAVDGGLPGIGATQSRVMRTSNGYSFNDPLTSKSDLPLGTDNQDFIPLPATAAAAGIARAFEGGAATLRLMATGHGR